MEIKILQVFYGKDGLPYKDKDRQVHFPITGTGFLGASNTTQIKFYYDELDNLDETTWVAVSKLPNGKLGSRVLESHLDSDLNEHYALLELDNYYTQYKGDVFISLQGYQGGFDFDYDEENSQYEIHGTPTIAATGSISFKVNYANQFVGSGETDNINFQRILAALGTKLGMRAYSEHVTELPSEGSPDVFYVVNDDPNNPNLANIYVWNQNTRHYIWVGDNTLDLGEYYTKSQGNLFEQNIENRVENVEEGLSAAENQIDSLASGSPSGIYATVTDLTAAHPTGDNKIYLVSADGHWYYWNGSAWTDGGVYLSTGNAVPDTRTIAGIDLVDDITKNEMLDALGLRLIIGQNFAEGLRGNNLYNAFDKDSMVTHSSPYHILKVPVVAGKTYQFYKTDALGNVGPWSGITKVLDENDNELSSTTTSSEITIPSTGAYAVKYVADTHYLVDYFNFMCVNITDNNAPTSYYPYGIATLNPSAIDGLVVALQNAIYKENIAENYDSTNTYNADDLVFYDGDLYQCKYDNVTGTWDDNKWTAIILSQYLENLFNVVKKELTPQNFLSQFKGSNIYNLFDKNSMVTKQGNIYFLKVQVTPGKTYQFYKTNSSGVVGTWSAVTKVLDADEEELSSTTTSSEITIPEDGAYLVKVVSSSHYLVDYFNFMCINISDNDVPTVYYPYGAIQFKQSIIEGLDGAIPYDSESNIPSYWKTYLDNKIKEIRQKQALIGKNCVSFIQFTDWHWNLNQKKSPQIIKYVADRLNINHIINTGDNSNRVINDPLDTHLENFDKINDMFSGTLDKIVITLGNHDPLISKEIEGTPTNTWLNEKELYTYYYLPYVSRLKNVHFAETGNYYYVDDDFNKIRYISLNCFDVPNDSYNRGQIFAFSQKQAYWLADEALNVPSGYLIVLFSHIPPTIVAGTYRPVGGVLISNILRAYINRMSITMGYDVSTDDQVQTSIDKTDTNYNIASRTYNFTNASGHIVFYTGGHYHYDKSATLKGSSYTIPIMNHVMSLDGIDEHQGQTGYERIIIKTPGTITEQAFDVYLVNRDTGDVQSIRIGAGDTDYDWSFNFNNPVVS